MSKADVSKHVTQCTNNRSTRHANKSYHGSHSVRQDCPSKFPKPRSRQNISNSPNTTTNNPTFSPHSNPHTTAKMPKPRRNLQATAEETMTPPPSLTSTQSIARVLQAAGNNLYRVELPEDSTKALSSDSKVLLVELPARFRSTIWIKRGGFVLIDVDAMKERENKLDGEIVNVVRNEKEWRKQSYW
jgi:probable RNA-binding protein EIF1AD